MPTLVAHSSQELTALCGQLSSQEQKQVFDYIKNIINKHAVRSCPDYSKYFGVLKGTQDLLEIQKAMRDEWG